jgi:hypothetical protein
MRLTYERHVVSSIALEQRREDTVAAKSSPKHSVPLSYRHREGTKRGDLPLTQPGTLVRCSTAISSFHRRRAGSVLHPPPPAMPSFPQFNPTRIRSYIFRLPLCTRGILAAIVGLYAATIPFPWLREFGQLEPAKMNFTQSMFFDFHLEGGTHAHVLTRVLRHLRCLSMRARSRARSGGRIWRPVEDEHATRS